MSSWSKERADLVKAKFYEFLNATQVKSKEKGWIYLGQNLYGAQITVIDKIFDGLGNDIHDFKILKSRQLGVSTIIRALMAFWTGIFEVTASLMFDTASHLDEARAELVGMMERFPREFEYPAITGNNRYHLTLANKNRINLISAGVRETKSSQALGTGSAITLSHRSELCNYGNVVGMETFRHSLARTNPNRLFVDESTAKGFNIWYDIWKEAKQDHHCITIFCGWWSHPDQKIDRDDPDYEKYANFPLSALEKEKIRDVYQQYAHQITDEQLAWIRREMSPIVDDESDADPDFSGDGSRLEQQPWTEEDAFQSTGAVFFDPDKLTAQMKNNVSNKYKMYAYEAGVEFTDFRVYPAPNAKSIQLKVWEEPVEASVYIVSADPAYGHSEHNDRSCVQVMRCYSDGMDQVAEYAWPLIDTRQFAWVIASLEAWYAGEASIVYRIVEINGPGEATFRELNGLKKLIAHGYFGDTLKEKGLQNIQRNVRNYTYSRTDSQHPGQAWMFKTHSQLKVAIMERMRDFTNNGMIRVRSQQTLEEMRTIVREGDDIRAAGAAKDDRVIGLAMAIRCWEERARPNLTMGKRTRAFEDAKRRMTVGDQVSLYNQSQFDSFLAGKGVVRRRQEAIARRRDWRG